MKIILLQDVKKVGRRLEVKNVADGYATNFLIPRGLAKLAEPKTVAELEAKKAMLEEKREKEKNLASKKAEKLSGRVFEINRKAGEKGELFASVSEKNIKEVINKKTGFIPFKIEMESHFKSLGEYPAKVFFTPEIYASIKIIILPEK